MLEIAQSSILECKCEDASRWHLCVCVCVQVSDRLPRAHHPMNVFTKRARRLNERELDEQARENVYQSDAIWT